MSKLGNLTKFTTGPAVQSRRTNETVHTVNYLMRKGQQELIVPRVSGGGTPRLWGEIIVTLAYPDAEDLVTPEGVAQYTVKLADDSEVHPRPLSQEANESDLISDPPDMRLFVPWYQVGDIVPLVTRAVTVGEVTETLYFFDLQMTRVAIDLNGVQSIAWNKEEERVMSVFGDVETEFEGD